MGFSCGIVGLPNVGKSTLFNALSQTQAAQAANYPFCTIDPNVGRVAVPDTRMDEIAQIAGSAQIIPTQLEFVDIAGLVKGASQGEGLGNQFLSHIREVDAIIYMLRCFEDDDVTHVEGRVNPMHDCEIVEMELILADLESLERRLPNVQKKAKGGDKESVEQLAVIEPVLALVKDGKPARAFKPSNATEARAFKLLQLLTSKPVLYVCNVDETSAKSGNAHSAAVAAAVKASGAPCVIISAKIESEIAQLASEEEKQMFLGELGLEETGLTRIISAGYGVLNLITYFTAGPKETRAWTILKGMTAPQAAGVIHTDFEKGFIRAETIAHADFVAYKGESGARDAGKLRLEGKEYIVADGDVLHFRFNT